MKAKTFFILLVATAVLAGLAALRFGGEEKTAKVKMGEKLFADLPINQVAGVTIAGKGNKVTLVKGEKAWQVQERDGYPAEFGDLRSLVVKLSTLKIGRSFPGSADALTRLSLVAPTSEASENMGIQITMNDASGEILADVIIGQTRKSDGGGASGQYMKKADADTVFLVDGDFQFVKTAPADWLQKEVLNIKADNIASVSCFAGESDKPVFTLARAEKGKAALLTPIPDGRAADSAKIDQVFDAMAPLTLDDVSPAGDSASASDPDSARLVYQLYDGREITVIPDTSDDGRHTLQIAAAEGEGARELESAGSSDDTGHASQTDAADTAADDSDKGDVENKVARDVPVRTVQQLKDELKPWLFIVKEWQFNSFITRLESLLEEVKPEGEGAS
jgi:hypothetical protein